MALTASGFGPSSGRLVHSCESTDARLKSKTAPMPPIVGMLSAVGAVLSLLFGVSLLYEGETVPGAVVLAATAALVAFIAFRSVRTAA